MVECHLDMVEVISSSLIVPIPSYHFMIRREVIKIDYQMHALLKDCRRFFVIIKYCKAVDKK